MLENLIVYLRTRPAAVLGDVCGQFLGGAVWHFGRCGYFWIHAVVYRGQTQSESEFQVFKTLLNMIDAACELSMKDFYSRNIESFSMCACRNHYKIDSCTKCLKSIVSKKTNTVLLY